MPMCPKRILFAATVFVFLLLTFSCKTENEEYKKSSFITKNHNHGIIIFVHGIFGDARMTWTNDETKAFFPELVSHDSTFKGFDILSYGYYTSRTSPLNVNELANDMRSEFQDKRLFNYDTIIFVCHSMGGLIVREFLIHNFQTENLALKTKLLFFYSTPTGGSGISNIAKYFSDNPTLKDMAKDNAHSYTADLSRNWLNNSTISKIPSYGVYEDLKTDNVLIVDYTSAVGLINKPLNGIAANHVNIVKPKDTTDKAYVLFRNAFNQEIRKEKQTNYQRKLGLEVFWLENDVASKGDASFSYLPYEIAKCRRKFPDISDKEFYENFKYVSKIEDEDSLRRLVSYRESNNVITIRFDISHPNHDRHIGLKFNFSPEISNKIDQLGLNVEYANCKSSA